MHVKFTKLLQEYIDNELTPLEKMIIEDHLASCYSCRSELNQLKIVDWELKNQPLPAPPRELAKIRTQVVKKCSYEMRKGADPININKILQLQLKIARNTTSFIRLNPVNQTISSVVKKSILKTSQVASTSKKKRKVPGLKFIIGQA